VSASCLIRRPLSPSAHVRRLPLSLEPGAGESLRSYVERLAAHNLMPTRDLLRALGLLGDDGQTPRGFGLVLDHQQQVDLAHATGLPPFWLHGLLLARFHGVCLDLSDPNAAVVLEPIDGVPDDYLTEIETDLRALALDRRDYEHAALRPAGATAAISPAHARRLAVREWMHVTSSQLCPECLAEDGFWQLGWRLPWNAACLRHRRLLVAVCPHCGLRVAAGAEKQGTLSPTLGKVPDVLGCANNPRDGQRGTCGHDLRTIATASLDGFDQLLDVQAAVHADLELDPWERPDERFARRRALIAFLLTAGERDQLPEALPAEAEQAWERHLERRIKSGGGRSGARLRTWTETPSDPALMLTLMATAQDLLDDPDHFQECAEHMVAQGRPHLEQIAVWAHLPEEMRDRVVAACRAVTARRFAAQAPAPQPLEGRVPRALPRRLWDELEPLAAIARSHDAFGELLSLAVARYGMRTGWRQAARSLGQPVDKSAARGSLINGRYAATIGKERFWAEIDRIAKTLLAEDVDYHQRERDLAGLVEIPEPSWRALTAPLGVHQHRSAARRRNAAAWLWAQLVCAPVWQAPAWGGRSPSTSLRQIYTRFERWLPEEVAEALLSWGSETLRVPNPLHWPDVRVRSQR
jgi:hypothetical protein